MRWRIVGDVIGVRGWLVAGRAAASAQRGAALVNAARESKVADLQLAVLVDQQVRWLEVAVERLCGVDCLDAA